jgi:hypothetical protein
MHSRRRSIPRYHSLRAAGVAACAAGALFGCAGKKGPTPVADATPVPVSLPPSTPGVRGSENGMEMMWWGVTTGSRNLAELLAPYLEDTAGIDARTRALWQSNGLRLVAVPTSQLDTIRQLLRQTAGVERQWLGQVGSWTDVIHGTAWHDLQPVEMDNGRLYLGPGRMRILLRCWTIPIPAPAGQEGSGAILSAMRAELLLQHQEPPRVDASTLYERPTNVTDPVQEGLVFSRLAAAATLPADRALLVIPESPQVDWRAIAQVPPEQAGEDPALLAIARDRPLAEPPAEGNGEVGVGQILQGRAALRQRDQKPTQTDATGPIDPNADISRTLGELLLSPNAQRLGADVSDRAIVRSVLVLVPRIPSEFRLDAPAAPARTSP